MANALFKLKPVVVSDEVNLPEAANALSKIKPMVVSVERNLPEVAIALVCPRRTTFPRWRTLL